MGRNGMGKTTTVRTICALLRPREGAITFAGQPTRGLADPPHRPPRHRPRARGPPLLRAADRRGEPHRRRPPRRAGRKARVETLFPRLAERRAQTRQHPLRRRAADARDRPRADDQPAAPDPRRGDRGPRPGRPPGDLGRDPRAEGLGLADPRHRQDPEGARPRRRPLLPPRARPHRLDRHARRR